MADTFDVVAGGKTTQYASAKEAGAAFFEADSATRPSVIHGMPAGPTTGPGGSARIMAGTEIHGSYQNGDTRYVKALPYSDKEVNNDFREKLHEHGMVISGVSPDYRLVEMIEVPGHPYFIGTQAHPEFRSRPNRPHPLFDGLIKAAVLRTKTAGTA